MKPVSWNCRGLGGSQKIEVIKRFKSMESASILLIQETKKMVEDSLTTLKIFWQKGEGLATNAYGASGGLLYWWDAKKFAMHSTIEHKKWLFIKLENKEKKEMFWIGNIYGPTIHAHKS